MSRGPKIITLKIVLLKIKATVAVIRIDRVALIKCQRKSSR